MSEPSTWRRCSACKRPIALGAPFWTCSVSTCNRQRTQLVFCSVGCWEVHLPSARHREAWAVERTAPRTPAPEPAKAEGARRDAEASSRAGGRRRRVPQTPAPAEPGETEVLIVASRLKDYVRASGGMNTSDGVLAPLSDIVRRVCDEAIRNARREGRRTLLDRDIPRG